MAFDVSALTDYVEQKADALIAATLLAPRTAKLIQTSGNIRTDVKSSAIIGNMDTDAQFQDGTGCGFNSLGNTTFSKRDIVTGPIKVQEGICPRDLEKKYTQQMLAIGSQKGGEGFSFEAWWAERKVAQAGTAIEVGIWQGDKLSANAQLNKFDGYEKIIAAAGASVIDANATLAAASITKANILAILDEIFLHIPTQLLEAEDIRIFTGYDILRLASIAGRDSKYFQYTTEINNGEIVVPGTNLRLVGVGGLNGKNALYAKRLSNMYIGTDLEGEETEYKVWYSQDFDQVRYSNRFRYGVQLGIVEEVVKFKI